MDDFVTPEPHRLTLPDGQFLDIRKRLTHGESEDLNARIFPLGGVDRSMVRTARILAYLLGWSFTRNGAPVPYSPGLPEQTRLDTIRALHQDRAVEIFDAIEAHEDAMNQERAAQKKILTGARAVDKSSPSPSAPAGASSGSAPSALTTMPTS